MFPRNPIHNNILGIVLIILGALIVFGIAAEFLVRAAIAAFGIYLIYHGLRLRNQLHKVLFLFSRFGGLGGGPFSKGPFGKGPFGPF